MLTRRAMPVWPGGKLAKPPPPFQRPHAQPPSEQAEGHSQCGAGGKRRQEAYASARQHEDQRGQRVKACGFGAKALELVRLDIRGAWLRLIGAFMPVAKAITAVAARDAVIRYRLPAARALRFFAHLTSPCAA